MDLEERLRAAMESGYADYFGVADLRPARDFIFRQGGKIPAGYDRGVSFGIALLDPVADLLPERNDRKASSLYRHFAYEVVNAKIDRITLDLAGILRKAGYSAFPVPASMRADDETIAAVFSHKLAAHLAGLGWIGKSCLLVTPDHGPRVRWGTVLTDAPLAPTGEPMEERCGDCTVCRDACPIKAIAGRAFDPGEEREARFDARACDRYFREMEKSGNPPVCGMCLYSCPWGRTGERRK